MRLSFLRYEALRSRKHTIKPASFHTSPCLPADSFWKFWWDRTTAEVSSKALSEASAYSDNERSAPDSSGLLFEASTYPVHDSLQLGSSHNEAQHGETPSDQHRGLASATHGFGQNVRGSRRIPSSVTTAQKVQLRVQEALQQAAPHALLPAILEASENTEYIGSLPSTTFLEILKCLSPQHFVEPFKEAYQHLHPKYVLSPGDQTHRLQQVFTSYTLTFQEIVKRRLLATGTLGIEEYKLLLNTVRSVGDGETALEIWTDMINRNIEPDLECYNYYFEARCWSGVYLPIGKHKTRIIPNFLRFRHTFNKASILYGYRVGQHGIKDEVTGMFATMVERGIDADVKTFCLLMVALAREGSMQGVKSIMKKVWNVDVAEILEADADNNEPSALRPDSPLHPTADTLYYIAHIFGSNNDLPAALRVVDYVSRTYSVPINHKTWSELLDWAFVLSTRRNALRREDGASRGQLPLQSMGNLWNIMVSAPYNVKPTMAMHNSYCRNLFNRQMLDAMLDQMRNGKSLYFMQMKEYKKVQNRHGVLSAIATENTEILHAEKDCVRQKMDLERLRAYRNFSMIRRWFRLLLAGRRWAGEVDRVVEWERQKLPYAIQNFWLFRPRPIIRYYMATGKVEILTTDSNNKGIRNG